MKLGIMQPYFFPYLGHFGLMTHTDEWVVFDITQYTPKTYMSRNEVLKQGGGRQRIFAELSNASIHINTHEAKLRNPEKTHQQVLGSLTHYKKFAPYYKQVIELVNLTFEKLHHSAQPDSLVDLNVAGLEAVCQCLQIPLKLHRASELNLTIPEQMEAGQWAPLICHQLKATGYVNPAGGKKLFNLQDFEQVGVTPQFLEVQPFEYPVGPYSFEANLSVLDVLMWNSPETINQHLNTQARLTTMRRPL